MSLFSFWFFDLRHALIQLGLIGVADAILLIDDGPMLSAGVTRWVVTIATLLVTGLLMAWLRRSLDREREETARLAVVAERMRIARDLHDAAGHGVTAISLQAAAGIGALDDGPDVEAARHVLEEIKRTSRSTMEDMRKLLGPLRPSDAAELEHARVSLSDLDQMVSECRTAGLAVTVDRTGEQMGLPPIVDQAAYRITQEALTNVLKHAGPEAAANVRLALDPDRRRGRGDRRRPRAHGRGRDRDAQGADRHARAGRALRRAILGRPDGGRRIQGVRGLPRDRQLEAPARAADAGATRGRSR